LPDRRWSSSSASLKTEKSCSVTTEQPIPVVGASGCNFVDSLSIRT
jgi:hypothetical protein